MIGQGHIGQDSMLISSPWPQQNRRICALHIVAEILLQTYGVALYVMFLDLYLLGGASRGVAEIYKLTTFYTGGQGAQCLSIGSMFVDQLCFKGDILL